MYQQLKGKRAGKEGGYGELCNYDIILKIF